MGNSLLAIEPRSKDTFCENAIRDQLSRILMSSIFVQSEGLGHFLSVFPIQMRSLRERPERGAKAPNCFCGDARESGKGNYCGCFGR